MESLRGDAVVGEHLEGVGVQGTYYLKVLRLQNKREQQNHKSKLKTRHKTPTTNLHQPLRPKLLITTAIITTTTPQSQLTVGDKKPAILHQDPIINGHHLGALSNQHKEERHQLCNSELVDVRQLKGNALRYDRQVEQITLHKDQIGEHQREKGAPEAGVRLDVQANLH